MTAQLSQPKATTDSLPTATRLLLGPANVSSFTNYNEATEQIKAVGKTSSLSLTANNVATSVVANQQFTGSDVYQLDFTFENIKLEVPANQGTKGQQYNAAVTWNLVTGPKIKCPSLEIGGSGIFIDGLLGLLCYNDKEREICFQHISLM